MADLKDLLAMATKRKKSLSDLDLTDDERLKMLLEDAGNPTPSPTPTPSPMKGGMPTDEDEMLARLLKLNRNPASEVPYDPSLIPFNAKSYTGKDAEDLLKKYPNRKEIETTIPEEEMKRIKPYRDSDKFSNTKKSLKAKPSPKKDEEDEESEY